MEKVQFQFLFDEGHQQQTNIGFVIVNSTDSLDIRVRSFEACV